MYIKLGKVLVFLYWSFLVFIDVFSGEKDIVWRSKVFFKVVIFKIDINVGEKNIVNFGKNGR